jgi:hypothetical protein
MGWSLQALGPFSSLQCILIDLWYDTGYTKGEDMTKPKRGTKEEASKLTI